MVRHDVHPPSRPAIEGFRALLAAVLGVTAFSSTQASERCEPAALMAAAERAQGGPIRTLQISGAGSDFVVGQGWRPRGPWPKFNVERYDRSIDFDASTSSLVMVRSQALDPPRGGARQPLERAEQVSAVAPGSARAPALRRELALLLPAGFIDAAARSKQVSAKPRGSGCALTVAVEEGEPITAELTADGRIERLSSKMPDDVLGDVAVETRFLGRWRTGDRTLPARIVQKTGEHPVLDLRIANAGVGGQVLVTKDLTPPLPDWIALSRFNAEQLGEGTFVIPARYSALAVDLGDYIVLIESPQSEARAVEVIAEARRLIPGKPIRYVVNTHAHFDHAAGLRTAVAEGATIVTHRSNVRFLRDALSRPRTLRPDALSRASQSLVPDIQFLPVDERLVLEGAGREIQLYHLKGMDHVEGMLVVYLPHVKTLVEADAFNPPAKRRTAAPTNLNPYTVQLLENIERLGLDVERLIPIHYAADGRRVGMDELRLAAGRLGAPGTEPLETAK
jgi:glyoxylase-like metal-dependent hydrolase (beta-lactamase superfamily II)